MQPSFRSAGTGSATNGTSNPTPTLPAGVTTNDILFLLVVVGTNNASVTATGYTQIAGVQGTNICFYLLYKRAGASETNPSITITNNANGAYAHMWCYRNCVTSGTPYEDATTTAEALNQTVVSSAVTPIGDDRRIICIWGVEDDTAITGHPPSGWNDRGSFSSNTGTDGRCVCTESQANPTKNQEYASATIASISTTSEYWISCTLCLLPIPETNIMQSQGGLDEA